VDAPGERPKRARRPVPLATEANLEAAALSYLERFDSTTEKLRRVLLRRVRRAVHAHGGEVDEGRRIVEALLARYQESGLLSDVRYATGMASGLHGRGSSRRAICQKLRSRGVAQDVVDRALEENGLTGDAADLEAARTFVRKRRLGPYRSPEVREASRRRDFAALARAGFPFDICKAVLGGDIEEEA
jgi:regulatory protein